jgi:hypothetical protein
MGCPDEKFQADFFNNIAAVAVVLMFTKVVMQRSRQGTGGRRCLAVVHLATVLFAGLATAFSLWATSECNSEAWLHTTAWVCLAFAAAGLLIDVIAEDLISAVDWRKNPKPKLSGT